jgi:hypothetical protein
MTVVRDSISEKRNASPVSAPCRLILVSISESTRQLAPAIREFGSATGSFAGGCRCFEAHYTLCETVSYGRSAVIARAMPFLSVDQARGINVLNAPCSAHATPAFETSG